MKNSINSFELQRSCKKSDINQSKKMFLNAAMIEFTTPAFDLPAHTCTCYTLLKKRHSNYTDIVWVVKSLQITVEASELPEVYICFLTSLSPLNQDQLLVFPTGRHALLRDVSLNLE